MSNKRKKFNKLSVKQSTRLHIKGQPETIDYNSHKPVFSFKHIKYGGGCCISNCDKKERANIIDTLLRLSQKIWKSISSEPKTGLGYEMIPQHRFKRPIPSVITPDVAVLVFRYSQAGRIAGFRVKDIYHVVMVGGDLYSH